jgi:Flp pilus assembly pilin Flp
MQPRAHPTARRVGGRRHTRGATVTEYAIIIFVVAVVGALGFRFFGQKLEGGVGKAGSNLDSPTQSTAGNDSNGAGGAGGSGGITTSHGANSGSSDPNAGFGGARTPTVEKEGTPFAKFAMIALGIIGAGAAFFAAMKGKHAR